MNNKILKLGSTELYNQVLAESFYDLPSDVPAGTTAIYKEGNTNGIAVKYEGRNNWVSETSEEYVPHTVTYKVGTDTYDTETVFDDKFPSPPVVSPAKAGYEFVSWQLDGTDYEFDEALTEDIELTANFIQLHKVTFKYLGKPYATEVVKNNEQCPIVGTPAPIGSYVVSGWKLNGTDFDFTTAVTSDIELEVVITPVCDVVFVVNGVAFYKTTVLSGSTVSAPTAPAVSGYVFSKWKIGETDFIDETIITKDTKIDGIYVPEFKVSFTTTDTDVSGMPEAQYVAEGGTATAPTPPTKEGYTFKNWLLNGEAFDFSTVITSDITLIAEFEEAPAPSGTVLIPVGDYTTSDDGDPSHGIYYDFSDIVPEEEYLAYTAAIEAGVENVKHTITIDGETFANETLSIIPSWDIPYLGNPSLTPVGGSDTGEDWCYTVSATPAISTRTATTINFGVSYTVEAPSGVYEWDGELDGSEVENEAYKFHLIPNSTFISKEDIIGATVTGSIIGETPFVITADDIEDYTEGCYAIETSLDTIIVIGSLAEYGFVTDGVYFAKLISDGKYVSKLTLAE